MLIWQIFGLKYINIRKMRCLFYETNIRFAANDSRVEQ